MDPSLKNESFHYKSNPDDVTNPYQELIAINTFKNNQSKKGLSKI